MSKYSIAKQLIEQGVAKGNENSIDEHEVIEALLVLAIQELVNRKGAGSTRQFVQYQLDSMAADGLYEIQRR